MSLLSLASRTAPLTTSRPGWLRRSLRVSLFEGMLAEIVAACAGGGLVLGWALELKCGPLLTALLGALPFVSQLVHVPSAWFSSPKARRRIALVALTASRQMLLGFALLPLVPMADETRRIVFGSLVALSSIVGVIGNGAWLGWMGSLVPKRLQARYFARRSACATLAGALGALGAGLLLDVARRHGHASHALEVLSIVGWAAGTACTLLLARKADPGAAEASRPRGAHRPWTCPKSRPILAYQLVWNGAIGLAAGLFGIFLVRDLRLGFTLMALHGATLAIVRAAATPLWGRALERVGARPVLVVTSFLIALVPLLWLAPTRQEFVLPLAFDALVGGILWAGHGVASFQLPFAVSSEESRPFYFAAFSSVSGVAFAIAAVAGGALLPHLPRHFSLAGVRCNAMDALFLLSAALRLGGWLVSLRVEVPRSRPVPELWRGLSWWPRWLRIDRLFGTRLA